MKKTKTAHSKIKKFKKEYSLIKMTNEYIIYKHNICNTIMQKTYQVFNKRLEIVCDNKECRYKKTSNSLRKTVFKNKNKINQKRKETCLKKYGTEFPVQNKMIKEKMFKSIKNKDINISNHKRLETCLKKYGQKYISQTKKVKEKIKKTWGRKSQKEINQIQQRIYDSKKKNGSFDISIPEDKLYKTLCNVYGKEKVLRQHKDNRYPFFCDFYIKDYDFFIECQNWIGHGKEPFDINNIKHVEILNKWKNKSKGNNMYQRMINTWTIKDPQKRQFAFKNNLKFREVF